MSDRDRARRGGRDGRGGRPFRGGRDDRSGRGPRPSPEERLSRFLAYVLRHHPEEADLELDERGSADLEALAEAIRRRSGYDEVTAETLRRLAGGHGAARFEIVGDRMRARYGHSLERPIEHEEAEPPAELFHGTTPEAAETILAEGLEARERQYVHLSVDMPSAREVGRRRAPEPVILRVDTVCASKSGAAFYRAGPAVWLSDPIPPECIVRVE